MWWEIDPDDAYYVSVYGYSKPEIKDAQVSGNARIVCGNGNKGESDYSFKNSDPFRVGKYLYDGNFPYNCFVEVNYKLRRNLRDVCKSELEDKEKNKKKGNIHCKFGVFETKRIKKNRLVQNQTSRI
uniref:ZP domain-containing protein n=1 Tax=Strongyloides papillosus TaxID=174720 RepID=A0A0N5BCX7_STREA